MESDMQVVNKYAMILTPQAPQLGRAVSTRLGLLPSVS